MEEVPKGTELRIERMSGDRCFVTYKGKPAYIRRQFLVTKDEFLQAQQKSNHSEAVAPTAGSTSSQDYTSWHVAGYAWPKATLSITNVTASSFEPLKNGGTYPLLIESESGYSIVCEGARGQKTAALLPLKDRFGNPLNIQRVTGGISVSSGFILSHTLDYVDLKPGVILLHAGERYPVLNRSTGELSVEYTSSELTQTVEIAETAAVFLSMSGYADAQEAVLNKLKKRADEAIHESSLAAVEIIFRGYQGELAQDTADAREALAKEYEEKFAAEQKAKGLVEFHGEWVTPTEMETRMAKEAEEARQQAEHDQWVEDHKSEIIQENIDANFKASALADAAYPDPSDFEKYEAYWEQVHRGYDAEICKKYGISQSKFEAILTEWGLENKRAFDQKWQEFQKTKMNGE